MDLFHIPGDTGGDWRIEQFVTLYVHDQDNTEPMIADLCEGLSNDDKMWMVYLFCICYNIPTALYIFDKLTYTSSEEKIEEFWKEQKFKLIFQSDRRWIKNRDEFTSTMMDFIKRVDGHPYDYVMKLVTSDPVETYDNFQKDIECWENFGPFGVSLFLRIFTLVFPEVKFKTHDYNWYDGRQALTIRECMYHFLYQDEKAEETYELRCLDKKSTLSKMVSDEEVVKFNEIINHIAKRIQEEDPNIHYEFNEGLSLLCFYRKLFKKQRYFGYTVDRNLHELVTLEKHHPDELHIWKKLREIRLKKYPKRMLGELNGWNGIRNELKSYFIDTGDVLTNVPIVCVEDW